MTIDLLRQVIAARRTARVPYSAGMSDSHEPLSLSGEELQTWAALATVLEWLPPALDAQLQRDADLSHFEYQVLAGLSMADGRYTLATLTTLGAEKLDQATPGHVQTVRRVLGSLTRAQLRQLRAISRRILQSLRDEEGWQPSDDGGRSR